MSKPSAFISYARKDDWPFVERLDADLRKNRVDTWWDRSDMQCRGSTFLQEIRDAIDARDRVIAVIGPYSISSAHVRYEWDYADLFGKTILPVLRLGDPSLIPDDLDLNHWVDFREDASYGVAFEELSRLLREPVEELGQIRATPSLPSNFLLRRQDLCQLHETLFCDIHRPVVITSSKQTSTLQGMGGIGKSVLAAAFARAANTRRACKDGVVWLTFGQTTERLLPNLRLLGQSFEDDPTRYTDEVTACSRLSDVLRKKTCLIVLDDIWDVRQAAPFQNVLGPRCRLLITTRDARIGTVLGAEQHRLHVLLEDEALSLLANWSDQRVDELPPIAQDVARECGYLPLALAMIGASISDDKGQWEGVLHSLRTADLARIAVQFPNYPYPDLLRALQVSANALDEFERRRYYDLAVFPEDTSIPEAALATLWSSVGVDEYRSRDLAQGFVRRSLARRDAQGKIVLHDLQWSYLRRQVDNLPHLHNRLLAAYQEKCRRQWWSSTDDGYIFQHLAYHLEHADRSDEMRQLLSDYRWLESKLRATDILTLLHDYDSTQLQTEAQLIHKALRLSAHQLALDKSLLRSVLFARLLDMKPRYRRRLFKYANGQWLRSLTRSVTQPGGSLQSTLRGHSQAVYAVALAISRRQIVSASSDCTIKIWDLQEGNCLKTLKGHTDSVASVVLTPDERQIVSASFDGTIRFWDFDNGRPVATLVEQSKYVCDVAVVCSGKYLISCCSDRRSVNVWNVETRQMRYTLQGHTRRVIAVAAVPDSSYFLSASADSTLRLWDAQTGALQKELRGHPDALSAVAVTPDGNRAAVGSTDGTVQVWDLVTGRRLLKYQAHSSVVTAIIIFSGGARAITASADRTQRMWNLHSAQLLNTFEGHSQAVTAIVMSCDESTLISASHDGSMRVWNMNARTLLTPTHSHSDWVTSVEVTKDGKWALTTSDDGCLGIWNLQKGKIVSALQMDLATLKSERRSSLTINDLAVSRDGQWAVTATGNETLEVWNLKTREHHRTIRGHSSSVLSVSMADNDLQIVSASQDNTLRTWNMATGTQQLEIKVHLGAVTHIVTSRDGRTAFSLSDDETVAVCDLKTGQLLRKLLIRSKAAATALALSCDDRQVLLGANDGSVMVWGLHDNEEPVTYRLHNKAVMDVCAVVGSNAALSVSADSTAKLWSTETGTVLAAFGADHGFHCCAAAPDGRTFVLGDAGGVVHFLRSESR